MAFAIVLVSGYSPVWSIIKLIVMVVLVLVLAYYATRFIAKYQNNTLSDKTNIRFLESYRIGGNKLVAIAKIGERYFALGIGKDEIHFISELQPDELKLPDAIIRQNNEVKSDEKSDKKINEKNSFKDIFSKMKNNHTEEDSDK